MAIEKYQVSFLKDVEPDPKWPQMCNDPTIFLQEISKRLFVKIDSNTLSQNIVISQSIPQAKDRGKLWIKTSWPYGLGFIANGEYQMDYSFTGYPVNIPFLHLPINPIPQYVRELGSLLLKEYGMEALETNANAKSPMKWYIFEPERIVV
jgi:hypothetical protein